MRGLSPDHDRYAAAVAAIDAANTADPTPVSVRGATEPLALVHGRLAAEWVTVLVPDAPDELRLAARAHHLRRWEVPRASYPAGRSGYLRWKRDQRARHAAEVATILTTAGYDAGAVLRVQALVRRDDLRTDAGAQAVEDAACLVFLETQLADLSTKIDHALLVDVLRKTAKKMSPAGLAAAGTVPLDDAGRALLAEALG